jgi:MFS family permease
MGLFAAAIAVGAVPAGLLGARLGRKRTMLIGFVTCATAGAMNTLIHTVPPLCITQVVAGFSFALILANALPLVLDHAPPLRDGVYSGLYYLATQAAEIMGPILAGYVLDLAGNARALFVYTPVALLLAFAFMLRVRRSSAGTAATPVETGG